MSFSGLVGGIIGVLVLVACCYTFIKKKWLAFIVANIIIFGASAYLVNLVFEDMNDMKTRFSSEKKLFLMVHNNELLGGFVAGNGEDGLAWVNESELPVIEQAANSKNYGRLAGEYYKVIIVNSGALKGIGEVSDEYFTMNESQAFMLLDSSSPIEDYVDIYLKKGFGENYDPALAEDIRNEIVRDVKTEKGFKAKIFRLMFGTKIQNEGVLYLMAEYKKGNIDFQPETMIFSVIRLVPASVFQSVVGRMAP